VFLGFALVKAEAGTSHCAETDHLVTFNTVAQPRPTSSKFVGNMFPLV
jgi:hypothetical protein